MAWAAKCDRCGRYYDYYDGRSGFAFTEYDRKRDEVNPENGQDLCPECMESLVDWFHEIRSREIDERLRRLREEEENDSTGFTPNA